MCQQAKQSRDKFLLSVHKALDIFGLIHCDVWCPYRTPSSCSNSYFLTVVHDYSRAMWIYLLVDKTEFYHAMRMFFSMVKR